MKTQDRTPKLSLLIGTIGLCIAGSGTAGTLQEGLVVHLPFDGAVVDTTGNVSPEIIGGANADAAGRIGTGALKFWSYRNASLVPEGEVQFNYVSLGTPEPESGSVLDLGVDVSFSVSFWVRFSQWSGDPSFFSNKNWVSGGNTGFVLATDGGGGLQWNYRESGGGRKDYDGSPGTVAGGAWHHVVMSVDRGGNATTYIDGTQVDSSKVATTDAEGNWTPLPIAALAMNIGQDGAGTYTDGGGVGILDGEMDDFGFWRRVITSQEVARIYSGGLAGVDLSAIADPTTPALTSFSPQDGTANANPAGMFTAGIEDAGTKLNPASVKLYLDEQLVVHTLTPGGPGTVTVSYKPSALFTAGSSHKYRLEFSDDGSPVVTKAQEASFKVGNYTDLQLHCPVYLETFDTTAEGEPPFGWTLKNYTSGATGVLNLDDENSDSYLDWVVISLTRLSQVFNTRRLNVAPWQVVNGEVLTSLAKDNICYAESDNRGGNQYQILVSPDVDLTGKNDIHLAFNSLYEQNQDSLGSVEYSIDEGGTWQPILYMIDRDDIVRTEGGEIDPVATLTKPQGDAAKYTDEELGISNDGRWGSFIGVTEDRYETLAPYISGEIQDNPTSSKRVEFHRLPLADNQAKVRLRFAQAGTGSWYFGIDNVGLYSIPSIPTVHIEGNQVTFAAGRLQSAPTPLGPWSDVPAATCPYTVAPTGIAGYFRSIR